MLVTSKKFPYSFKPSATILSRISFTVSFKKEDQQVSNGNIQVSYKIIGFQLCSLESIEIIIEEITGYLFLSWPHNDTKNHHGSQARNKSLQGNCVRSDCVYIRKTK
jgi:hypothetical protein